MREQHGWHDPGAVPMGTWPADPTLETMGSWTPQDVLVEQARPFGDGLMGARLDAAVIPSHRRRPGDGPRPWNQIAASVVGVLSAVTVVALCLLGWILSYDPPHDLACSRVPRGLSALWPLVIYGPWFISCLSAIRAVLEGRPLRHSWIMMIVFSCGAAGLCIAGSSPTALDTLVAGLPPITALVCPHQLVRQLDRSGQSERRSDCGFAVRRRGK